MSKTGKEPEPKKDRTHGTAHVEGLAKKGGAGGKYTWGKAGDEVNPASPAMGEKDPNYCSDDDADSARLVVRPVGSEEAKTAYKTRCSGILNEYWSSEDEGEVVHALQELNEDAWLYEFVKTAVVLALEKHDRERELVSRLFSDTAGSIIRDDQLEKGFQIVLDRLHDLALDTPAAVDLVGNFLARAVVDEVIPPIFLQRAQISSEAAKSAVSRASHLLEGKGASERVLNLWGENVARSAKKLKKSFKVVVDEYLLDGGDVGEAEKCLRELNVPTTHFQFVKICITTALEGKDGDRSKISRLLKALSSSQFVSEAHIVTGFKCCVDRVGDLCKDISPAARTLLLDFISLAIADGYLPKPFKERAEADTARILENEKQNTVKPPSPAVSPASQSPQIPANAPNAPKT